MMKEICEAPTRPLSAADTRTARQISSCRAFRQLQAWQVEQYCQAVNENRWYMGERLRRDIDWQEAEKDFLHNEYYGCAPKWRKEFCTARCKHFHICDLGRYFCG